MKTANDPLSVDEHRAWLVRFHPSGDRTAGPVEVRLVGAPSGTPDGGDQCYRFTSPQAWLDWCAEIFGRDNVATDSNEPYFGGNQ